jgi:prophage regulatory protein
MASIDEKLDAILALLQRRVPPDLEFWRLPRVMEKTGMGRTLIYDMVRDGRFPDARQLGAQATAWRSDEVLAWMAAQPPAGEVV